MTWELNVSEARHLSISSSVQGVLVSFCSTSWSDFAIVFLSCFMTHTSRDRKYALNFFWHVIVANLKFFSIHSANSVRNESHRSSSSSLSHSCIFAFINLSSGTKAEVIIDLQTRKRRSFLDFAEWFCRMLWLRSDFARIQRLAEVVCGVKRLEITDSRWLGLRGSEDRLILVKSQGFEKVDQDLHKCFDRFVVVQYSGRQRSKTLTRAATKQRVVNWIISGKFQGFKKKSRPEFSRMKD
jgi:hypothetical protein